RFIVSREPDKAVPLLEKLVAAGPPYRLRGITRLIPLSLTNGQPERGVALATALLEEPALDYSTLYVVANQLLRSGETNLAKSFLERGLTLDPRSRHTLQISLARLYCQMGAFDEAVV